MKWLLPIYLYLFINSILISVSVDKICFYASTENGRDVFNLEEFRSWSFCGKNWRIWFAVEQGF